MLKINIIIIVYVDKLAFARYCIFDVQEESEKNTPAKKRAQYSARQATHPPLSTQHEHVYMYTNKQTSNSTDLHRSPFRPVEATSSC